MILHRALSNADMRRLIYNSTITLGGNRRLKIYGTLSCASGKRMKAENRVFFRDEAEAWSHGFRPCAHCMRNAYRLWKHASTSQKET